jgi:hypothetical protein
MHPSALIGTMTGPASSARLGRASSLRRWPHGITRIVAFNPAARLARDGVGLQINAAALQTRGLRRLCRVVLLPYREGGPPQPG